jgi:hypothetical protein
MNSDILYCNRPTVNHVSGSAAGEIDDDQIVVPPAAVDLPICLALVSTRLAHVLQDAGIQRFGELCGWTYSRVFRLRNCGRKTIEELRELLGACDALAEPPPVQRLSVPASLQAQSPFDLPVSPRLGTVLRENGIARLGDLHEMSIETLRQFNRCGRETALELRRLLDAVARGEPVLLAREFSPTEMPELLRDLTAALAELPLIKQEVVKTRLGGGVDWRRWSVSTIANALGTSVNQLSITLHRSWGSIRILAGPGPCAQLRRLAGFCQEKVCPLTVPLLSFWMRGQPVFHPRASTSLAFYLRLMRKLEPTVPAWPEGQCPGRREPHQAPILKGLRVLLKQGPAVLPCRTAYERLLTLPTSREVTVADFLDALQHARTLAVRFPAPDQAEVGLRSALRMAALKEKPKIVISRERSEGFVRIEDRAQI